MGKLQELARVRFAELYLEAVEKCTIYQSQDEKGKEIHFVTCKGIDRDEIFQQMANANTVFHAAKEMGL